MNTSQNSLSDPPPETVSPMGPDESGEQTMPKPAAASDRSAERLPTAGEAHSMLPKIVKFDDLPRCGEELWIEHNGQLYRLRSTRRGKLILTK